MNKIFTILSVLATIHCIGARAAHAEFLTTISVEVSTPANGFFHYKYTITNLHSSDLNANTLDILIDPHSNLTSISGPANWLTDYSEGDTHMVWSTFDPLNFSPILPGSSAIFSFDSSLGPSQSMYSIDGVLNVEDFPVTNSGQIAAPGIATIPEPSAMIPMGMGVATLAGYGAYCRRKSSPSSSD